jgi:hypothetical protein
LSAGQLTAGLRTAVRLAEYDDIVDPVQVLLLFFFIGGLAKRWVILGPFGAGVCGVAEQMLWHRIQGLLAG